MPSDLIRWVETGFSEKDMRQQKDLGRDAARTRTSFTSPSMNGGMEDFFGASLGAREFRDDGAALRHQNAIG
jgi:hypothetical protein